MCVPVSLIMMWLPTFLQNLLHAHVSTRLPPSCLEKTHGCEPHGSQTGKLHASFTQLYRDQYFMGGTNCQHLYSETLTPQYEELLLTHTLSGLSTVPFYLSPLFYLLGWETSLNTKKLLLSLFLFLLSLLTSGNPQITIQRGQSYQLQIVRNSWNGRMEEAETLRLHICGQCWKEIWRALPLRPSESHVRLYKLRSRLKIQYSHSAHTRIFIFYFAICWGFLEPTFSILKWLCRIRKQKLFLCDTMVQKSLQTHSLSLLLVQFSQLSVCLFPSTAMAKYYKMSGVNNRNLSSLFGRLEI